MKTSKIEILLAGSGGQGIMLLGKLLAQAGLASRKNVTWMPSYGAEVRGGTAYAMTKISDKEIANPIITAPDILVAMNEPSLIKYENRLKPKGLLVLNRSLIKSKSNRKDISVVSIPMTQIASKLGSVRSANMVALGALLKRSKLFPVKIVINALHEMLGPKEDIFMLNKRAVEEGYKKA
ncbi:MAG: 2-oxoacid:acceptor oxidoreductase family protein [Candidatus Omnitrophota bacterium]|nr:2-oxoacid:acceptor oxidoreductase family protein [Candidatus Omnitrophota bacterium]